MQSGYFRGKRHTYHRMVVLRFSNVTRCNVAWIVTERRLRPVLKVGICHGTFDCLTRCGVSASWIKGTLQKTMFWSTFYGLRSEILLSFLFYMLVLGYYPTEPIIIWFLVKKKIYSYNYIGTCVIIGCKLQNLAPEWPSNFQFSTMTAVITGH